MRNELVFAAVAKVQNRYALTGIVARSSRALRHPYRDSIPTSINAALSKISGTPAPEPLASPSWRAMLLRTVALHQAPPAEEAEHHLPVSSWPKPKDIPLSALELLGRRVAEQDARADAETDSVQEEDELHVAVS